MRTLKINRRTVLLGALAASLSAPALVRAADPALRVGAILPLAGRGLPLAGVNLSVAAESARKGLVHATDDLMRAAPIDSPPAILLLANAPEARSARRAAERLIQRDRATVLIGGFTTGAAQTVAEVAQAAGALFINIASPADALRRDLCPTGILHIEADARSYIAALAEQYLALGRTRWHVIQQNDPDNRALLHAVESELAARASASVTGVTAITEDPASFGPAFAAIETGEADVAVLLTDWLTQLAFLSRAEAARPKTAITGFPWAATQTRDFYNRCRQVAPTVGAAARVALWEARADTPDARALNADFLARWRQPMDASAWAASTAMRLAAQGAKASGSTDGFEIGAWLSAHGAGLQAAKDTALTVDPLDAQLRQPLFAVRVDPNASTATTPEAMVAWAELIGRIENPRAAAAMPDSACVPAGTNG